MKGRFQLLVVLVILCQLAFSRPVGEGDGRFLAEGGHANGNLEASSHGLMWQNGHGFHGSSPSSSSPWVWSNHLPMHRSNLADVQPTDARSWHHVPQQHVPIANEVGASSLQSESPYPTLDFPGSTSRTGQPELDPSIAPPSPLIPSRPEPVPHAGLRLTNGKPLGVWEDNMRAALGNPFLDFTALDGRHPTSSRLFVAQHGSLELDHHPTSAPPSPLTPDPSRWHFTSALQRAKTVYIKDVNLGQAPSRVFVYLNSRFNMHYLNEQYFLNQLHFLPVDPQKLRWDVLNSLFTNRHKVYVFPPRQRHGLPLLVAPHNMGTGKVRSIMGFTGQFEDDSQLVSLWSPLLQEKQRTTLMFYGIGQLGYGKLALTSDYLDQLAETWNHDVRWAPQYFLEQDWPHGWHAVLK